MRRMLSNASTVAIAVFLIGVEMARSQGRAAGRHGRSEGSDINRLLAGAILAAAALPLVAYVVLLALA